MSDFIATPIRGEHLHLRHHEIEPGAAVIHAEGEVDLASAPALKGALLLALQQGATRLVLDLSGVEHMDSTGLGVLVGVRRRLPAGGLIVIAAARPNVRDLFQLTGLDQAFTMFASVEAAAAHVGALSSTTPAPLSPDAALVLGLAATAIPFADSRPAEAERWLRVLRLHGDAGRALSAAGLGEAPLAEIAGAAADEPHERDGDPVAKVVECATRIATERGSGTLGTADLLAGVMDAYGEGFDRVLAAHGTDRRELAEHLPAAYRGLAGA